MQGLSKGRHMLAVSWKVKTFRLLLLDFLDWTGCWELKERRMSPESFLSGAGNDLTDLRECAGSIAGHVTTEHLFHFCALLDAVMPSDGVHQDRQPRYPLSLPLSAHMGMSLEFTVHYASSNAAAAPCLCGWLRNQSVRGWWRRWNTAYFSTQRRKAYWHTGRCAAHVTHFQGPSKSCAGFKRKLSAENMVPTAGKAAPPSFTDFTTVKRRSLTPDGRAGRRPASARMLLGAWSPAACPCSLAKGLKLQHAFILKKNGQSRWKFWVMAN